ncbi:MAG: anhydro-N-acetylmuramic acid kinase [Gammaproteobacteria bacterium]
MTELYLGLMSGTSIDGVDTALCEMRNRRFLRVVGSQSQPYGAGLRDELLELQRKKPALTLEVLSRIDHAVAKTFADAAMALLREVGLTPAEVKALGSHGQTVFHDPSGVRASLQLGDPSLIAALTGITTVADFRRADIARGGQGAPLVPAFHHSVFASDWEARAVVNIGGIANLTALPGADAASVRGFDTGPGNGLMDEWTQLHQKQPLDREGRWAAGGHVHDGLLKALLADPYFARAAPKSTGRDYFNLDWVGARFPKLAELSAADVQRTLCELTAVSISQAVQELPKKTGSLYVCGGGALNLFLMRRLKELLPNCGVSDTGKLGLAPRLVEPAAFAWLAMRALAGLPGNLPAVTGASREAVLGGVYRA